MPGLAHGDLVSLSLTLNGLDSVPVSNIEGVDFSTSVRVVSVPKPTALEPSTIFIGEREIELDVTATVLWDSEWLSCKVAGLRIPGTVHTN